METKEIEEIREFYLLMMKHPELKAKLREILTGQTQRPDETPEHRETVE